MFLSPQQYFHLHERRPRKRFGQNFLARPSTAERIVGAADLRQGDVAVEIGPGLGALTQFLLPLAGELHLVELDRDLAEYLRSAIPGTFSNVHVHQQDVLGFDFSALSRSTGKRLVVLGNLPYNISSPLVFHLLESAPAVERGVFMVQKEVGERLAAKPGGKEYGVLSVLLGVYSRVEPLFTVGPSQFYPQPKVESLVLRIDFPQESPQGPPSFRFLRGLVSIAFQQRRKTLQNGLKGFAGMEPYALRQAFLDCDIDPMRRPETLSPEEFFRLGAHIESIRRA